MYGVFFAGHNDLRRILTDYGELEAASTMMDRRPES